MLIQIVPFSPSPIENSKLSIKQFIVIKRLFFNYGHTQCTYKKLNEWVNITVEKRYIPGTMEKRGQPFVSKSLVHAQSISEF